MRSKNIYKVVLDSMTHCVIIVIEKQGKLEKKSKNIIELFNVA